MIRSIQHPGGKVTVQYRHADLEVMLVEVAAGALWRTAGTGLHVLRAQVLGFLDPASRLA